MATYTDESGSSFASSGVGTAGLTLGVIGTALASGILGNGSGFGGLFGNSSAQQQLSALQMENSILKANAATDTKLVEVYTELRKQDKTQDANISALNSRVLALETAAPLREQILVDQIQAVGNAATAAIGTTNANLASLQAVVAGITKTVVPNTSVCPGWGSVTVAPATSTTSST